jgi:predicted nucleic acid-binding protein
MIVIVDTNILFGALITPNGKIAQLLSKPTLPITRISCHFLMVELFKHQTKIVQQSKRTVENVTNDLLSYLRIVQMQDENLIAPQFWQEADRLTKYVDGNDISFVALTLQTGGVLWTGDKKLTNHLKAMGFDRVVNTTELYELLNGSL